MFPTASSRPSSRRRIRGVEASKRALAERPPPNVEASKLAEACTPYTERMSRLTLNGTSRAQRDKSILKRATRTKTMNTKTRSPLAIVPTVEENEDHANTFPLVPSQRVGPSVGRGPRSKEDMVLASLPKKTDENVNFVTRRRLPITPNNDVEQPHHFQSSESSGSDEDQLDRLDIEILSLGTKKRARAPSLGLPPDPEAYDIQHNVEDEPSPKKKRKMMKKAPRHLPVNELIIVPERVVSISDDGEDNETEIEGNSDSLDTTLKVSHQQPKKQKRKKKFNRSEGFIIVKFPKEKSFKIYISMFHKPGPSVPLSNAVNTCSDGFDEKEMKPTGRTIPTKRYSGRYTDPPLIVRKTTQPIGELTIVADRPFGYDVQTPGKKKKRKQKAKALPQNCSMTVHVDNPTQNSGIATPPTKENSGRKPAADFPPVFDNFEAPLQNPRVTALQDGSEPQPVRDSSLIHNAKGRSQQSQNLLTQTREPKNVVSLEERKDQLRKAEEKNAADELSKVIVSQRSSDTDSFEESSEGSDDTSDSDENSIIDMEVDAQNIVPEGNPSDQSDEENPGLIEDEEYSDANEDDEEEEEENIVQPGRDEVEEEVEEKVVATEESAQQVRAEKGIENRDLKVQKGWKPEIPQGVTETEDEIQSSSPVVPYRNRYRPSAFRNPSRISSQQSIVRKEVTYQHSTSQSSVILGESQSGRFQCRTEIPETQMQLVEEEEVTYHRSTSQGSVELGDSQPRRSHRRTEIPETQLEQIVEEEEEEYSSQMSFQPNASYFDRASQDLQSPPRRPSLHNTTDMPPPDSRQSFRTPSLGPKRTPSRQPSLQGSANKSLAEIAYRTSSQFGTLGSARKKRTVSVPLLTQTFRK